MALQLATNLNIAVSLGLTAEGTSRAMLAVTIEALVRRSTVFATQIGMRRFVSVRPGYTCGSHGPVV